MTTAEHRLAFGHYQLDTTTGDLYAPSGLVPLAPKALALLRHLVTNAGRLASKRELLDTLWPDVFVTEGVLKVCVREIRQALDDDAQAPRFVETAHRRGYRFVAPVRRVAGPAWPPAMCADEPTATLAGSGATCDPGPDPGEELRHGQNADGNEADHAVAGPAVDAIVFKVRVSVVKADALDCSRWRAPRLQGRVTCTDSRPLPGESMVPCLAQPPGHHCWGPG